MNHSSSSPEIPPHGLHFPVIAIALIAILLTAVLLLSYYIFVLRCCLNQHRVDVFNRLLARHHRALDNDIVSSATSTATASPPGLDEAVIRSIPVIKFRKSTSRTKSNRNNSEANNNSETEFECAVCLSEFEEGEKLRVIPNCCHAFHVDCIDIWLQNCPNCPLCRTDISANSVSFNPDILKKYCNASSESNGGSRRNNCQDEDGECDDNYVVIEIQGNNLDEPRLISKTNSSNKKELKKKGSLNKKLGHVCSMGDELIDSIRKKDEEFQIQTIRRSISMDLSNIRDFCFDIPK